MWWTPPCSPTGTKARTPGPPPNARRGTGRGRGTGVVGDGVAGAAAALPEPVDDDRGRSRADRRPGRRVILAAGARAVRRRPLAAGRADRQLPYARRDHGGGRAPARRGGPRPAGAAVGA